MSDEEKCPKCGAENPRFGAGGSRSSGSYALGTCMVCGHQWNIQAGFRRQLSQAREKNERLEAIVEKLRDALASPDDPPGWIVEEPPLVSIGQGEYVSDYRPPKEAPNDPE